MTVALAQNAVKDGAHITFGRIRKVMSRLKISAISYLNTAPLMWDFEHGQAGAEFDISYTIPSACAEALRTASIGVAQSLEARPATTSLPMNPLAPVTRTRSIANPYPIWEFAARGLFGSNVPTYRFGAGVA